MNDNPCENNFPVLKLNLRVMRGLRNVGLELPLLFAKKLCNLAKTSIDMNAIRG